jgi:hypothetical protein
MRWLRGHLAVIVATVWVLCVVGALVVTLRSFEHSDFDGLNNMFQIPLAVPWFFLPVILPIDTSDSVRNAWMDAGFGLVNAAILYALIARTRPRTRTSN